jgi:hypothetical protein
LAWLPWVATVESLRCITGWRRDGALRPVLGLARRFAADLDREPTGGSLVCVPVAEPERVRAMLDRERIRAAVRGDGIRFSVHVWNDEADIERAVDAIRPFLRGPGST